MSFTVPSRQTRRRVTRFAALAALALIALAVPQVGSSVVGLDGVDAEQPLPNYDSRAAVQPTSDQLAAARGLGADVQWNDLGTPSSIYNQNGYVATGIAAADATSAARSWIDANAALFGASAVANLAVWSSAPLTGSDNAYAVTFRQKPDGVSSFDGIVTVALVGSKQAGWKVVYSSSTLAPAGDTTGSFDVSPAAAWTDAARSVGTGVSVLEVSSLGTKGATTTLDVDGFSQPQAVTKVAFGTPYRGARAAYETTIFSPEGDSSQSAYQVVVDAETGDVLYRQNAMNNATDNPTWKDFTIAPKSTTLNKFPWGYPNDDIRQLWCWTQITGCKYAASDTGVVYPLGVASKAPWDVNRDPVTGATVGTPNTTIGNNVDDARVWSGAHGAFGNPALYRPSSPTRDYQYPFTNAWYTSGCNPANLTGNGNDIDAATVNLFGMHNRMHDFSYYLGFDEGHWNAQQYNNGVTTVDPFPTPGGPTAVPLGNDGVLGNAQSGALPAGGSQRDNANMGTGADGPTGRPQTNMFLWQSLPGSFYAPCVDGDYDMTVIGHEYGHAIENRMIGKGVGQRQGNYAGGMGEAFGDFDALEYLYEAGYGPVPGSDPWTEGAYVTGNHYNGIRDYLASAPLGGDMPQPGQRQTTNPLNLGDYGFDLVGPEVHADGEIWVAVEYDIRDLFLNRYKPTDSAPDVECLRGRVPVTQCPGNRRWIQLYYDSMVIMPRNATILQARDAMLAADVARFGGVDRDILWQAFAQRGFGQLATTTNNNDTDPVPDFSSPFANNGTLSFTAKAPDGTPVKANIYVGDYQARVTKIADTDPATVAGNNADNVVPFVPFGAAESLANDARYRNINFIATAPGYGAVRFSVQNLRPGESRPIAITFPVNLASSTSGATVTGDGTSQANLIDDSEATVWNSTVAPVAGKKVVVDLAGTAPVEIKRINVSAQLVAGLNRFTALRSFEVWACTSGKAANPTCDGSTDNGWRKILTSSDKAFPSVNPRPVAPDLTLRSWILDRPLATHLKFVVVTNQCTGQTSFQGDQDNDPGVNADCRNPPGTGTNRGGEVHAAEFQVFSDNPSITAMGVTVG